MNCYKVDTQIINYYEQGYTIEQIAKAMNTTVEKINIVLKRNGIKK